MNQPRFVNDLGGCDAPGASGFAFGTDSLKLVIEKSPTSTCVFVAPSLASPSDTFAISLSTVERLVPKSSITT